MVNLPTSYFSTEGAFHRQPRFSRMLGTVTGFFEVIAAATRVSRAVEARRQPAEADLRTLGIQGKLPEMW